METKNAKKHLLIAIPTYLVVIAAIILCCLFIPKACQKKTEYKLDVACTNCTVDNQTELHNFYPENDVVTLTFKANDLYVLPGDIKVTSGNQQLVKDTDYTYSDQTGVFSFNIHGDTNVVVDAISNTQVTFILDVPANTEIEPRFYYKEDQSYDEAYPGTVDWGDGTTDNKVYHHYAAKDEAKTYHVTISDYTHDYFAFQGASGYSTAGYVTSVTLSTSIKKLGYSAFDGCRLLSSITIPNSVTSIGDYAFSRCESLPSITIPNSVTTIGSGAFSGCESLPSISIPNSVTSIGDSAFSSCSSLSSINIPNSVTSIRDYAFSGCESLPSITIPNSVTTIGSGAFYGCSSLTSISIPNSVTSIGNYAFSSCSSLSSITIPNSVTSIGDYAFSGCSSLSSISIPNSVTSIGDSAFSYCSSLTSITVDSNNIKYDSRDNCNAIIETSTNTLIIGCKNTVIPSTVTSIGDYAFYGCSSLNSINIPNSVTSIGRDAFSSCSSLSSITIPNSVATISDYAFYHISADAIVDMSSVDHLIPLTNNIFYNGEWGIKFEGTIKVKLSLLDTYKNADYWKNFANYFVGV